MNSRKSKLREIKASYIFKVRKLLAAVLDEYDLQDSFQKRINPERSRELPAQNAMALPASMITLGVSLRNENLGVRARRNGNWERNIECAREEHIIS